MCFIMTKKSTEAKVLIKKYTKDFDDTLNDVADVECIQMIEIAKGSIYEYKDELKVESSKLFLKKILGYAVLISFIVCMNSDLKRMYS